MASGLTRYADITALVNDIYHNALFALRERNLLAPTVMNATAGGMNPRKVTTYGTANPRAVNEGVDVAPTQFTKTLLSTITPARVADTFLLTDEDMATDPDNARNSAAMEMGAAFAEFVDQDIASQFSNLTAGTISLTGGSLTWAGVVNAHAILHASNVPGPYVCVLHPYQWADLFTQAVVSDVALTRAPAFQDRMVNNYFVSSLLGDVTFVVSSNVSVDSTPDATAGMYNRDAIIFDVRKPFSIRPQRDESREALELNASIWYETAVWRAALGVQIISDATTPS